MAKVLKKMSTGKKVGIGTAVVVAVGAILCYFFCPCFKKQEEEVITEPFDYGSNGGSGGNDGSTDGGLPKEGGPIQTLDTQAPPQTMNRFVAPKPIMYELMNQRGGVQAPPVIIE